MEVACPPPPGTRLPRGMRKSLVFQLQWVNKVGRSYKPPPNEISEVFPGHSAIV